MFADVFLVHSSDSTRVDLTIPGEQYFYLKAINAAERQKWLVALGTAKACLTDNRTKREKGMQMLWYNVCMYMYSFEVFLPTTVNLEDFVHFVDSFPLF